MDELARKGVGTSLYLPEPFCSIEKGFMVIALTTEEEGLRELYWSNLSEIEQSRILFGGYEP